MEFGIKKMHANFFFDINDIANKVKELERDVRTFSDFKYQLLLQMGRTWSRCRIEDIEELLWVVKTSKHLQFFMSNEVVKQWSFSQIHLFINLIGDYFVFHKKKVINNDDDVGVFIAKNLNIIHPKAKLEIIENETTNTGVVLNFDSDCHFVFEDMGNADIIKTLTKHCQNINDPYIVVSRALKKITLIDLDPNPIL